MPCRAALCHPVTASQICTVHVLLCAILSPPVRPVPSTCCSVPFCHRRAALCHSVTASQICTVHSAMAAISAMSTASLSLFVMLVPWVVRALSPVRSTNGVPLPRVVHAVHHLPPSKKRVLIVGDIHGADA